MRQESSGEPVDVAIKSRKRLVIDASIAGAAGGPDREDEDSARCSQFLIAARHTGHKLVVTPSLAAEWVRHRTRFSTEWQADMISRHQTHDIPDDPVDQQLREQISQVAPGDGERDIMLKDVHLIEAALVTDRTVTALDNKVRGHFDRAGRTILQFRNIVWVNPIVEKEDAIAWVNAGAKAEPKRCLGFG